MRDHGGDLDRAMRDYGGDDWIDLSTGINPVPYPLPAMDARCWGALPTARDIATLTQVAQTAFGTTCDCVPLAGASAAIQLFPRLTTAKEARVLAPTYNEHAASLRQQGWQVTEVQGLAALEGADLAVVVNPNNPDGQRHDPATLLALSAKVGLLVVDESFADPEPDLSVFNHWADKPDGAKVLVLRSFGKFYGLAGVRLGFACGDADVTAPLRTMAGPWAVSGPAIAAGTAALGDIEWQARTIARLAADADRMDAIAQAAGWSIAGGTTLFRTYETGDAEAAKDRLARAHIWTRAFPYSKGWLRLGLPADEAGWNRLEAALRP